MYYCHISYFTGSYRTVSNNIYNSNWLQHAANGDPNLPTYPTQSLLLRFFSPVMVSLPSKVQALLSSSPSLICFIWTWPLGPQPIAVSLPFYQLQLVNPHVISSACYFPETLFISLPSCGSYLNVLPFPRLFTLWLHIPSPLLTPVLYFTAFSNSPFPEAPCYG